MDFKDLIIILLLVVIVGGILFGTVGNFLGTIASFGNGISDAVSGGEGYVYKGGPISEVVSSAGNVSSAISNTTAANVNSGNNTGGSSVAGSSDVSGASSSSGGGGSSSGGGGSSSWWGGNSGDGGAGSRKGGGGVVYEDYQHDYETGLVDSEGNPIYLTIISTSGGQMDPGIYEVYWSALGPINQTRIG